MMLRLSGFLLLVFSLSAQASNTKVADPTTIVFSFQKQKDPDQLKETTKIVSEYLTRKIGLPIEVLVPTSYGATVQGLIASKVHVAYMDSLPFILATSEIPLEIIAVERRNGRNDYDSLLVVGKESPIQSIKDLKGKRIAFTSQTSTSGYLFPFSRMVSEKLLAQPSELNTYFSQVNYAGGYDKALLAVAHGQTDVAAFSDYVIEGPKADLYGTADTRSKIRVLARTPGVPTHLIAVSKQLSPQLIKKIQDALLALSTEKPELLSSVYGAAQLMKANSQHVEKTRAALRITGLEPKSFVK